MTFTCPQPGLFVVTYRVASDLVPAAQRELIAAMEKAITAGPVAVVFDVGPDVRSVDLSVPGFWLDVTGRLPLAAMSIVTGSAAVRIAARGFKLAQSVRKHPIAVESHQELEVAIEWARAAMGEPAAQSA